MLMPPLPIPLCRRTVGCTHKVRINKEYHSVCPLVLIGTLPNPLSPASVPLPPEPGGGAHSPGGEGLGESQFRRLEKKLSLLNQRMLQSSQLTKLHLILIYNLQREIVEALRKRKNLSESSVLKYMWVQKRGVRREGTETWIKNVGTKTWVQKEVTETWVQKRGVRKRGYRNMGTETWVQNCWFRKEEYKNVGIEKRGRKRIHKYG